MMHRTDTDNTLLIRLRKFGITMAIVLSIIALLLLWYDRTAWIYLLGIAALFLLSALISPRLLIPIEWFWMKLGRYLGYVTTNLILIVTFFFIVTPIGLIGRLFGRDPLHLKIDKQAKSYWTPVDPKGPLSRPEKPY
jgi:hypothetical protein